MGFINDYCGKKNHYYHDYIQSFVSFLIPKGKTSFEVKTDINFERISPEKFDYVVASDVLGYVYNIEGFLKNLSTIITPDGRVIITQYNVLWGPILSLASKLGLRRPETPQNWLSMFDLENFALLANLEVLKSGTKMLMPGYIPLISKFMNMFISNIFPFSKLGIFHYLVLRKKTNLALTDRYAVSMIVATRNEAGNIAKIIKELPSIGKFTELIFVEGGSSDNTLEVIKKEVATYTGDKKIKFAVQTGKGKGDAIRKGFDMATGDILLIYDADMTVPADELLSFYEAIVTKKADFINGSRLVYPMEKESMKFFNILGNKFFSLAFSFIFGQGLKDTLCGTKVLWKKDYEDIKINRSFFGDFDPFGDFDLLLGATKLNLKIIDLPVHYKERTYGETNINRWSHGWLLLRMTIFAARKIKFI